MVCGIGSPSKVKQFQLDTNCNTAEYVTLTPGAAMHVDVQHPLGHAWEGAVRTTADGMADECIPVLTTRALAVHHWHHPHRIWPRHDDRCVREDGVEEGYCGWYWQARQPTEGPQLRNLGRYEPKYLLNRRAIFHAF